MRNLSRLEFSLLFFFGIFLIAFLPHCGGVNSVYFDGRDCVDGISPTSTGTELYQLSCNASGCHDSINLFNKPKDVTSIQNAILANKGGMGFLSCLSFAQLQAISQALQSVSVSQ
jgi:hypothetical protein